MCWSFFFLVLTYVNRDFEILSDSLETELLNSYISFDWIELWVALVWAVKFHFVRLFLLFYEVIVQTYMLQISPIYGCFYLYSLMKNYHYCVDNLQWKRTCSGQSRIFTGCWNVSFLIDLYPCLAIGLSVNGDSQGLERLLGALSAHMWPGMILKSGNRITVPSLVKKEGELNQTIGMSWRTLFTL